MRQVVLVCGPPCSGKSTLVEARSRPTDIVLDLDKIAVELGSDHPHNHRRAVRAAAERRMLAGIGALRDLDDVRAWVVRGLPRGEDRDQLAAEIDATAVIVLNPGRHELHERAKARSGWTHPAIDAWLADYTPGADVAEERTSRSW